MEPEQPSDKWRAGQRVRVCSLDLEGVLAAIESPLNKSFRVHANPWNQVFWWIHIASTGELRAFHKDNIQIISGAVATDQGTPPRP